MNITGSRNSICDQAQAHAEYPEKRGVLKQQDVPQDSGRRWLTLVSLEWLEGPELLLATTPLNVEP